MTNVKIVKKNQRFIDQHWFSIFMGIVNKYYIKEAKFKFILPKKNDKDNVFDVLGFNFSIHSRYIFSHLKRLELIIIPSGIEYKSMVHDECIHGLFEKQSIVNTSVALAYLSTHATLFWI